MNTCCPPPWVMRRTSMPDRSWAAAGGVDAVLPGGRLQDAAGGAAQPEARPVRGAAHRVPGLHPRPGETLGFKAEVRHLRRGCAGGIQTLLRQANAICWPCVPHKVGQAALQQLSVNGDGSETPGALETAAEDLRCDRAPAA